MTLEEFISNRILTRGEIIEIPDEAQSFSLKKGRVYFYRNGIGKYEINSGSTQISFPEFEKHKFNIHYGNPRFS